MIFHTVNITLYATQMCHVKVILKVRHATQTLLGIGTELLALSPNLRETSLRAVQATHQSQENWTTRFKSLFCGEAF